MTETNSKVCRRIKGGETKRKRGSGRSRETFEEEDEEQKADINSFGDSCLWGLFVMNSLSVTVVSVNTHTHTHTLSYMLKSCLPCDLVFMGVNPSPLLCSSSSCLSIPFSSMFRRTFTSTVVGMQVCLCASTLSVWFLAPYL